MSTFKQTLQLRQYTTKIDRPYANDCKSDPNFISGFTDAEGCFSITIYKYNNNLVGWSTRATFKISLHKKDLLLLKSIQDSFGGVGSISNNESNVISYRVESLNQVIHKIIAHYDKYPLITQKKAYYELFNHVINMMGRKLHLTSEGLQEIVNNIASINKRLSDKLKIGFPNTINVTRPLMITPEIAHISPN